MSSPVNAICRRRKFLEKKVLRKIETIEKIFLANIWNRNNL